MFYSFDVIVGVVKFGLSVGCLKLNVCFVFTSREWVLSKMFCRIIKTIPGDSFVSLEFIDPIAFIVVAEGPLRDMLERDDRDGVSTSFTDEVEEW